MHVHAKIALTNAQNACMFTCVRMPENISKHVCIKHLQYTCILVPTYVYVYTLMYVCVCACLCMRVCVSEWMFVCMDVCISVCMYVCMYVCM